MIMCVHISVHSYLNLYLKIIILFHVNELSMQIFVNENSVFNTFNVLFIFQKECGNIVFKNYYLCFELPNLLSFNYRIKNMQEVFLEK